MKSYLDCWPCFFKQALCAARMVKAGSKKEKQMMNALAAALPKMPMSMPPPYIAAKIDPILKKILGKEDIYQQAKIESNRLALGVYDKLSAKLVSSQDKLLTAVELAIAGNIIDYGAKHSLDVEHEITKIINAQNKEWKEKKTRFDYSGFQRVLGKARNIVYLADNAGETVFDRILIEQIKRDYPDTKIIYVVKSKPALNDALLEDALFCGIDKSAKIMASGVAAPGTVLKLCSREFVKVFNRADMIISKGQGNFEALSESKRPIFFMLMAKCPVIARHIGCSLGDILLLSNAV